MDAMEPATRFSDLECEEMAVARPSRWVVVALLACALVMLSLAALSSERASTPRPRNSGISQPTPTEVAMRPALARSGRRQRPLLY
jgi:hypothetical protein